jgi:hypothetical protein
MRLSPFRVWSASRPAILLALFFLTVLGYTFQTAAQAAPAPDTLVLSNGDTLHGKLVNEVDGTVTFHQEALGDVKVKLTDVKELHASGDFAVIDSTVKRDGKIGARHVPIGPVDVAGQAVTVHTTTGVAPGPVPISHAAYIVDKQSFNQQAFHEPSFFDGWNGAAAAGVTIVRATQNQSTESGSVGLVRAIPGVVWLLPRNRTLMDFSGSSGKITEPTEPTVKTSIYHADAERDEYFSPRFYALGLVAFDHNFSQGLALQSIYGGGIGWTAFKSIRQELDLKATLQYESQQFLATPPLPASPTMNLISSTFGASYAAKWKLFAFAQQLAYITAWNSPHAYSANETNTLTFPAYKNLSFSLGTLNSYLNDPPVTIPPAKRNSFQFTMGLAYAIKSKY